MFYFKEYNYNFHVRVVANCPMNMSDWQAAAKRTGCNDTNVYHCVPDKFHFKLVEFCYYKTQNLVGEGIEFCLAFFFLLKKFSQASKFSFYENKQLLKNQEL